MTKPTRVGTAASNLTTSTTPKSAGPITCLAGDKVTCIIALADTNGNVPTCAPSGGGFTMTLVASDNTAGRCPQFVFTGTVDVNRSLTMDFGWTAADTPWGGIMEVHRVSDGFGTASVTAASGVPQRSHTTTQDNSAIVMGVADWSAGPGASAYDPPVLTGFNEVGRYVGDSSQYGLALGDFPDAGAAGAKTIGMTNPPDQNWTISAVEVKGSAGLPPFPAPEIFLYQGEA